MAAEIAAAEGRQQRLGLRIIAVLAVLTVVEYVIAVSLDSAQTLVLLLAPIAIVKAWLVLQYFMHAPRLWRDEGSH